MGQMAEKVEARWVEEAMVQATVVALEMAGAQPVEVLGGSGDGEAVVGRRVVDCQVASTAAGEAACLAVATLVEEWAETWAVVMMVLVVR